MREEGAKTMSRARAWSSDPYPLPKESCISSSAVEKMLKDIKTSALTKNWIRSLRQVARCRDGINSCFSLPVLIWTFAQHRIWNCCNRCQPWTIALTRVFGMSVSWLLLHSVLLIAVVSILESAWWFLFLYSYPLERDSTWAAISTTARVLLESFFSLWIMSAKCTIAIVNHVWCSLHFYCVI